MRYVVGHVGLLVLWWKTHVCHEQDGQPPPCLLMHLLLCLGNVLGVLDDGAGWCGMVQIISTQMQSYKLKTANIRENHNPTGLANTHNTQRTTLIQLPTISNHDIKCSVP